MKGASLHTQLDIAILLILINFLIHIILENLENGYIVQMRNDETLFGTNDYTANLLRKLQILSYLLSFEASLPGR